MSNVLFVQVSIKISPTDSSLEGYVPDPEFEYCFVVTGIKELYNSINIISSSRGGFLLIKGHEPPSTLAVIYSANIDSEEVFLCRPVSHKLCSVYFQWLS